MSSNKREKKKSDSTWWHNLKCDSQTVIKITKAWDYIYKYKCPFSHEDINDLEDECDGEFSCKYFRGPRLRTCYMYPAFFPRSVIWYDCVDNHSATPPPETLSSSKTTKVTAFTESDTILRTSTIPNKYSTSTDLTNSSTPVIITMSPLQAHSSKSNDAVIAGSVIGVLGVLALILLLICFVLKRRKSDRNKDTRSVSVTNAVGQNSNVLYIVSDDGLSIPGRPDDEPPPYNNLDNIPVQNHIYTNDNYDFNHQDTDNYNHIHGTVIRKSLQSDDYNHTDTEAVNVSGRQREDYNHIAVNGQSGNVPTVIEDDYNHIKSTEGVVSHGIGEYNHIGSLTDGEDNKGYLKDGYNHIDNSNLQNSSKRGQPGSKGDQGISNVSKLENNYENMGIKGGNNDGDDFEPDDTYVYT